MAQVKIYGLRENLSSRRISLSEAIHRCVVTVLGLPPEKKCHRFIPLETQDFLYPPDRTENYTIIEIMMMSGRTTATKKKLIHSLFATLTSELHLAPSDIEVCLIESPPENWGFRGQTGDEIQLSYKVQV